MAKKDNQGKGEIIEKIWIFSILKELEKITKNIESIKKKIDKLERKWNQKNIDQ
ncbi:MAG: hypothetical protein ACPLYC_00340 [Minisyncoccia bacterium]